MRETERKKECERETERGRKNEGENEKGKKKRKREGGEKDDELDK